ncbi:MAG: recombinase family protein [Eubacteriales bacterium]
MQNYKVGLYLRLSREDNNSDNESMSISNQRTILAEYANERGWEIEDIYIDDGYSGVSFERPEFIRLKKDIENKRINMVITKDLSRLGRNYILTGEFTDYFLPKHGVRYIAVNENYDSTIDNDFMPFQSVFNEYYAKDTSRKIKSTKLAQMKKGEFIGSQPVMGYMRNPENKHHLIFEDDGAAIVKRMFKMYALGNSARHIADVFNNEGILTPREHYFNRTGKPNPYVDDSNKWGSSTILRMLNNQVYIGHMCQGKRQKANFKVKRRDVIPENEWIVVENTHEPLIDEITWKKVQTILSRNKKGSKPRLKKDKTIALFSNKIICADCGAKMTFTYTKNSKYRYYYRYRCSTYNNQGKNACGYNSIREDELETIVLNEIKKFSKIAVKNSDRMCEKLITISNSIQNQNNGQIERKIKKVRRDIQSISSKIDVLLSQMAGNNITETMFKKLINEYEQKQNNLNSQLLELKTELSKQKTDNSRIENLVNKFKKNDYITKLDRETVVELIDFIEVFKKDKIENEYLQRIDIHYNFVGQIFSKDYDSLKLFMNQ